ncbi:hypothetical protein RM543_08730 [Roseicyclus sp. F158]|uniref:Uncharacterized protein n=1 Tax=Tropicimonas omnivorans TaxID=3075590 RepID=A0ABU3DGF6_9RHOB|nr:hypothetical protein [Roseicyclus sp. F158]MDT0682770.1 hypothetical protein [Roseicyclus sp. F158]
MSDNLKQTAKDAQHEAEKAADHAQERAEANAEGLKGRAKGWADQGRAEVEDRVYGARDYAAGETEKLAGNLRDAADDMSEGSYQERFVGQFAKTLNSAADNLRDTEISDVVEDLSNFARRNPLAFLGGAALVGFAASRFAKATHEDDFGAVGEPPAGYSPDGPSVDVSPEVQPDPLGARPATPPTSASPAVGGVGDPASYKPAGGPK